ncbi:hypothetical protein AB1N83_013934 [Pleurotus pulmonarius]
MDLQSLVSAISKHPELFQLEFSSVIEFIHFACLARPQIRYSRPGTGLDGPPKLLPPRITFILSEIVGWLEPIIYRCWEILGDVIWTLPEFKASEDEITKFNKAALQVETSYRHIFPPLQACLECVRTAADCNNPEPRLLTEPKSYKATLFTISNGALPVYTTSLYCRKCHTRYYHNYRVHGQTRIYYEGVPNIIQVAEHYFMESALLELIATGKVFGWLSGTNWARIYNTSLGHPQQYIINNSTALPEKLVQVHRHIEGWQSSFEMRPEDVLNGFFLYSLLLDKAERRWNLTLPHNAESQVSRLKAAIAERNCAMEGIGQEAYLHACDVCCHVSEDDIGQLVKLQAAICDGIQIGHPCCGVHDCKIALKSHAERYCPSHQALEKICAVTSCDSTREAGHRTCAIPEHRKVEQAYFEKGSAMFQLRARLKRAGYMAPQDSFSAGSQLEDLEEPEGPPVECNDKPVSSSSRVKGLFTHNFTHTQLLFMRPCGVILSRVTMYGSEAISAVSQAAHATFPTPESTPEFLFFDNNCKLVAHQRRYGDTHFANTGQPVDVFHFKSKHKESDVNCQRYCNPAAFPELMVNGKWRFNSSICEQTNVWLGEYRAILRNMEVDRFNFYLDEMIKRRNRFIIRQLGDGGHKPWEVPFDALFPSSTTNATSMMSVD